MCSSRRKGGEPEKNKKEKHKMLNTTTNNQRSTSWQLARASVDGLAQAIESGRKEIFSRTCKQWRSFPPIAPAMSS
jgi:hypothetical protein